MAAETHSDVPDDDLTTSSTTVAPQQHALARYTLARLALFFIVLVVGYLVGLRTWLLLLVALMVSGVASYFLLNRQRDEASVGVYDRVSKVTSKLEQRRAEEDAAAERMRLEESARHPEAGAAGSSETAD